MDRIQVLICHCVMLLGLGVESMLAQSAQFDVMSSYPKDLSDILALVRRYRPDVVILGGCFDISQNAIFSELLAREPHLRVISVHTDNNWLQIYQRRDVLVTPASNLVQIIAGD